MKLAGHWWRCGVDGAHGEEGGEPIGEVDEGVAVAAGGAEAGGPPDEGGDADAAFEDVELCAGKAAVEAARVHGAIAGELGAVVAGEDDDRVLGEAVSGEGVEDIADAAIEAADHAVDVGDGGCEGAAIAEGGEVFFERVKGEVGGAVGEGEEEGLAGVAVDEGGGLGGEDVGDVAAVGGDGRAVVVEMPVDVGGPAAEEAGELGEAAAVRVVTGSRAPLCHLPTRPVA